MSEREQTQPTYQHTATSRSAPRGADDRKRAVRPKENPAPSSPPADRDAVEKGVDVLERVKPY